MKKSRIASARTTQTSRNASVSISNKLENDPLICLEEGSGTPLIPLSGSAVEGRPTYWLPDNLDDPFRFVIEEQGAWYDPALNTYLRWLEHGVRVLDLGNDPGLYAIPAAQQVGPSGRLESLRFSAMAQRGLLKSSEHMHWVSSRLSDMNSSCTFTDIDVIRLGAAAIDDQGGWLAQHLEVLESRPWLYVSTRHSDTWNTAHLDLLVQSGYRLGRYLPFLDALVPYDWAFLTKHEPYCVGLFAIPQERISDWIAQERWAEPAPLERVPSSEVIAERVKNWSPVFRKAMEPHVLHGHPDHDLEQLALGLAIQALNPDFPAPPMARLADWQWSIQLLLLLIEKQPTVSRWLTLSRLRFAAGERALALRHLETVHAHFEAHDTLLSALFLPPDPSWDTVDPADDLPQWLYASVLDTWVRYRHLSAYTLDKEGESVWQYLHEHNALPANSQRALALYQQRLNQHRPVV